MHYLFAEPMRYYLSRSIRPLFFYEVFKRPFGMMKLALARNNGWASATRLGGSRPRRPSSSRFSPRTTTRSVPEMPVSGELLEFSVDEAEGEVRDTIALLHGFPDGPAVWSGTSAYLRQRGYRVVRIALRASSRRLQPLPSTRRSRVSATLDEGEPSVAR